MTQHSPYVALKYLRSHSHKNLRKRNLREERLVSRRGFEGTLVRRHTLFIQIAAAASARRRRRASGRWESCYLRVLLEWSATPSASPINICRYAGRRACGCCVRGGHAHPFPTNRPTTGSSRHLDFTPLFVR